MASIENKSRTQISVARRPELTKLFPHNKEPAASAYCAELTEAGHEPLMSVLDEAYLVRFKVNGKRRSHTARSFAEAQAVQKQIEAEQHRGLFVDYTKAHQTKFHKLLERYLRDEAPRLKGKGYEITGYKINTWLADNGLPELDLAAIHAAHTNPAVPGLQVPVRSGKRMSAPCTASSFVLKPFSELEPGDFDDYVDERMEVVAAATADRELDIVRRVCSLAINKWRIHVNCDPFAGYERPDYFNERDRRLRTGEEGALMTAAAEEDRRRAIQLRLDELLADTQYKTKYQRMSAIRDVRAEAEATCNPMPLMEVFVQFQLQTGARRSETMKVKWSDIDFDEKTAFLPETKNGLPRKLALRSGLVQMLRDLPRTGEYVFAFSVAYLRKAWTRICTSAGIPTDAKDPNRLRIHDLRHEAISRVAEAGSNTPGGFMLADLQNFSGHKDTRMLVRYLHLSPSGLAKRLDAAFADQEQVTLHHGRRRLSKSATVTMAEVVQTPIVATATARASLRSAGNVVSLNAFRRPAA